MNRYSVIAVFAIGALFVIAYALLLGGSAGAAPRKAALGTVAVEGRDVETCFPKAAWDAAQEDRPCYLVGVPQEDGSGSLNLGTEGYELATCIVPNVREERGEFVVRCRRTPKH